MAGKVHAKHFDLDSFLPYLLNQAAEAASRGFQDVYRAEFGMTRPQWRVLAHLGKFERMTARDICLRTHDDKTAISRAVAALELDGLVRRDPAPDDGRAEILSLTIAGKTTFDELAKRAIAYDAELRARLKNHEITDIDDLLAFIRLEAGSRPAETDQ